MKSKFSRLILYSSLLCFLFSCKKNSSNADIKFPRNLYITQVIQKDEVRLYTADGEITDAIKKQNFLGQDKQYFNLSYKQGDSGQITFLSRDTALITSPSIKSLVNYNNGQFIFTGLEYLLYVDQSDILYKMLKYPNPLSPNPLPSSNTLNAIYMGKELHVGYGDFNTVKISCLSYKIKSGTSNNYDMRAGTLFNEFDKTVLSQLKTNDTLAVQESSWVFKTR